MHWMKNSLAFGTPKDWGTGLERALYEEALIHLLGGRERLIGEVEVGLAPGMAAKQKVALCGPHTAIRVTAFEAADAGFAQQLIRFLNATNLKTIQWINIARRQLTLKTLHLSARCLSAQYRAEEEAI